MGMRLNWIVWMCLVAVGCSSETTDEEGGQLAPNRFGDDGSEASMNDPSGSMDGGSSANGDGDGTPNQPAVDGSVPWPDGGDPFDIPPTPTGPGTIVANPNDPATFVYDQSELRTYEITISQSNLAFLDDDPRAEEFVAAEFHFGGVTYPVGMRYKGSVGAFYPPCTSSNNRGPRVDKCSIKVSFDWSDERGRFYGLKRLNFHSMNRDPSHMRDRLGSTMFREFGLAAPRAVHARLLVNGELEGLFALVEQVDGRFTRSRFTEGGEGNLYKEIWPIHDDPQAYINALESNRDEMPVADKILAFKDAIGISAAAMEQWLDRELTMKYVAADRVMIHDDGPFHWWCSSGGQGNNPGGTGNHNYYWYEAANADRLWIIPWDLDNIFNRNGNLDVEPEWTQTSNSCGRCSGQRPPGCDPMITRWSTDWRSDFESAADAFIAGPFRKVHVDELLNTWESQIADAMAESAGVHGAISVSEWQTELSNMKGVVDGARTNRGFNY